MKSLTPKSKPNPDGSTTVRCQDGPHRGELRRILDSEDTLIWMGKGVYLLSRDENPEQWGLTWSPDDDMLVSKLMS